MGYTTDFIGCIDIYPPMNESEQAYLTAFAESSRGDEGQSTYDVPGNPAAEQFEPTTRTTRDRRGATRAAWQIRPESAMARIRYAQQDRPPSRWCGWVPAWSGACLTFDGKEKFYQPMEWLHFLIQHFLCADAKAASAGLGYFENFTFDHVLDGVIAGSRRDTGELFLIDVRDNVLTRTVLRQGDPQPWELEALPYQTEVDRSEVRRPRPSRPSLRLLSE